MNIKNIIKISKKIRSTTLEISYKGGVEHLGSALSVCDIITSLYYGFLNINKNNLKDLSRDQFILSKGHSVAALYSTLYHKGLLSQKKLFSFGKNYGLCKHPIQNKFGIDTTSGSLGMGLGYAMGKALALKLYKKQNKIAVLVSDGECDEGSVWESILLAPTLKLDNLYLIIDKNSMQCLGNTRKIVNLESMEEKLKSFGWKVKTVNGHNIAEIIKSLKSLAKYKNSPKAIIANTTSAYGISFLENQLIAHYKILDEKEYLKAVEDIKKL